MNYLCLVYANEKRLEEIDDGECLACGDAMRASGHYLGGAPLHPVSTATTLRVRDGPAAGLALIDALLDEGELDEYRLAHAARAELCRRLGRVEESRAAYRRALELAQSEPDRRFVEGRLAELDVKGGANWH